MSFVWPLGLVLIVAAPAVLGVYLWSLRRRRKQAVTYSSVALLRSVMPRRSRWRRHVPAALLIASLATLGVASGRPQVTRVVSTAQTSIVLAVDVSRSMCATDVDPNRLAAAQKATRSFIDHQVAGTRIGLVVFAGIAQLAVAPTRDRGSLRQAVDGLTTSFGTAIGAAMLKSLDALATVNPDVKPVGDVATDEPSVEDPFAPQPPPPSPSPGTAPSAGRGYVPDIVVLLTDGANNRGITPLEAVPYAVERRVRVYTIGFGTSQIAPLECTAAQAGGEEDQFLFGGGGGGGGQFFGGRSPLRADLPTLKEVASRTGGQAYDAEDASQLQKVFAQLPRDVTSQKKHDEITVWFAAMGALLAAAAVALSQRWSPYP